MQDSSSIDIVAPQSVCFDTPLHLKSGAVLKNYELVYETYGKLNATRSNAVLVCHALSGNHHLAGFYADDPKSVGWWNNMMLLAALKALIYRYTQVFCGRGE